MSSQREIMRLLAHVLRHPDWTVTRSKGHLKVLGPEGQMVVVGTSTSDTNGVRAVRALLRRAGAPVRAPHHRPKRKRS